MTTERHLLGPRPGAHGFGSFCRNKRTSARGAETPQEPLSFCHSRKLVPDVSNRGSSVLMNPGSFSLLLSVIPDPDRGSSVSLLTNDKRKNPGSFT